MPYRPHNANIAPLVAVDINAFQIREMTVTEFVEEFGYLDMSTCVIVQSGHQGLALP